MSAPSSVRAGSAALIEAARLGDLRELVSPRAYSAVARAQMAAGPRPLTCHDVLVAAATFAPRLVLALTGRVFAPATRALDWTGVMGHRPLAVTDDLARVLHACLRAEAPIALGPFVSMLWQECVGGHQYESLREALDCARRGLWQLRWIAANGGDGEICPRPDLVHVQAVHLAGLRAVRRVPAYLAAAIADVGEPLHLELVEAASIGDLGRDLPHTVDSDPLRRLAVLVEQSQFPRVVERLVRCVRRLCDAGVLCLEGDDYRPRLDSSVRLTQAAAEELYRVLARDTFDAGDRARFHDEL